jgi:sister chromatid cohesion protein PDS5
MARGLRSKPTQPAESESADKAYDVPGLDFNEALTWRPGKAIPVGDLLTRLQTLRTKLAKFEEEQVDSHQWTSLAEDLANNNLIGHKDKGVRAWAISCVLDVLKICAPDAPFQQNALRVSIVVRPTNLH